MSARNNITTHSVPDFFDPPESPILLASKTLSGLPTPSDLLVAVLAALFIARGGYQTMKAALQTIRLWFTSLQQQQQVQAASSTTSPHSFGSESLEASQVKDHSLSGSSKLSSIHIITDPVTGMPSSSTAASHGASPMRALRVVVVVLLATLVLLNFLGVPEAAGEMLSLLIHSPEGSFSQPTKMAALALNIREAAQDNLLAVTALFCTISVTLLTFCIPGTIMLNVLFGALLGVRVSVPLCVGLGALGGTFCYGLSSLAGTRLAERIDERLTGGKGINKLRRQVDRYRQDLFAYLLFLRLTPLLPNWLINLASPVVGVPLRLFVLATTIGITPQTYLACRFGSMARAISTSVAGDGQPTRIVEWHDTVLIAVLGVMAVMVNRLRRRFGDTANTAGKEDVIAPATASASH